MGRARQESDCRSRWNYIVKGGFLDGKAGFVYHVLWSFWYQFLISVKIIERQGATSVVSGTQESVSE